VQIWPRDFRVEVSPVSHHAFARELNGALRVRMADSNRYQTFVSRRNDIENEPVAMLGSGKKRRKIQQSVRGYINTIAYFSRNMSPGERREQVD
jgi:hypothetical protein